MAPQVSALSQTLQSLTLSKFRELEKQRSSYEERKAAILAEMEGEETIFSRVSVLLKGTNAIHPNASKDPIVANITRWMQQHLFDPSITDGMLRQFEDELRSRLDAHSRKLSLAALYPKLLTEWTNSPRENEAEISEDEYMVVDEKQKQRLQQLCDQFEETVFTPLETSESEIHAFLDGLFADDEKMKDMIALRSELETASQTVFVDEAPFDRSTLMATIKGLLTEDILSEAKQEVLKGFLKNKVALTEISDVLNMRWADLENWDWFTGDDGIPVLPRQQLNGKYRIWMDEDALQLIFVQYIGTRLCNLLKTTLKDFIKRPSVWNWEAGPLMTERDKARRTYYLGTPRGQIGPHEDRKSDYINRFFLFQLPLTLTTLADGGGAYDDDDDDSDEDSDHGHNEPSPSATSKNIKQQLLRKIATETLIYRSIHNEAAVIQSDLRWYATGLAHSTVFAAMSYVGISQSWINFFRKYLASPLNMDMSAEGRAPMGPRIRKRGVPMAHSSEKFIGELILFFMDLTVNRKCGLLLYRLHDDLYLCGEPEKCAQAWEAMGDFAKVTGLEFNASKTGSVYLSDSIDPMVESRLPKGPVNFGFLQLDPRSGEWVLDEQQVNAHVAQLKKQLDQSDSVMAWIRTWNSCIGRFFKNTFGQPAMCFGQRHMIETRFGVSDIPDALFYYPEDLGGLGLRNPFISLFLVRGSLKESPAESIEGFRRDERKTYDAARGYFDELDQGARRRRFANADSRNGRRFVSAEEMDDFMSFEEWSRFRWLTGHDFRCLYEALQDVPSPKDIRTSNEVRHALDKASSSAQGKNWDAEEKWILNLYAPDVLKNYGGMSLVDKKYLPVGVMAMVKERRVKWQMVL
ncbi:hypothetical protein AOCH_002786 [Aspergillus ochraceoroseus]|uniref:Reverse transcriptase domain-containing protein n=1 Tax=Aspergillus ochraceoroseus TaxID=138278 RepID=A0A0F8XKD4_9EURO|nr:hypothetical protein AOCH_002786 [Aspergillus ochraceoroseus]